MGMEIHEVGFYDTEGVYFHINPMNGFDPNSTECARGVDYYVVRVSDPDNNNYQYSFELKIARELAIELSNLYYRVSARARVLTEERRERQRNS